MRNFLSFKNMSDQGKSAVNFMCVQGFMWFAWAFTCYNVAFLQNIGFSASSIGSLNAICSAVAIFAMMFWGMLSDKINSIKKTLLITTIVSVILQAIIPFFPTDGKYVVIIFFIHFPLISVFRNSVNPLLDNFSVRLCAEKKLNYSTARSFGSFLFTVGSLVISWVLLKTGDAGNAYLLCGIMYIPAIISIFMAHDTKLEVKKTEKISVNPKPLLTNYYYMVLLVFAFIVYIACTAEYSFITYFMEDIGVSNSNLGNFLAVRAVAEVPSLLLIVKLRKRFKLKNLMMAGFALMGTQAVLFGFVAKSATGMLIICCLFGIGNGVMLGSTPFYLYHLAPKQLKATSQTIYTAVCSISGIVGNLLGGIIYEIVGARMFYIGVGFVFYLGVVVFFIANKLKRNLENPADIVGL